METCQTKTDWQCCHHSKTKTFLDSLQKSSLHTYIAMITVKSDFTLVKHLDFGEKNRYFQKYWAIFHYWSPWILWSLSSVWSKPSGIWNQKHWIVFVYCVWLPLSCFIQYKVNPILCMSWLAANSQNNFWGVCQVWNRVARVVDLLDFLNILNTVSLQL